MLRGETHHPISGSEAGPAASRLCSLRGRPAAHVGSGQKQLAAPLPRQVAPLRATDLWMLQLTAIFMSIRLTSYFFRVSLIAMKYEASRPYVMKARAEAASATRNRILASARALLVTHSFEDMTIDAIAEGANTTVRTVMRVFGSKEELFAQALHSLGEFGITPIVSKEIDALLTVAYDFYEKIGDTVIRWLGDEGRIPAMHEHLEIGRKHLRSWVSKAFEERLSTFEGTTRKEVLDGLIVAFDVYTWKLLRRDFRLSRRAAQATAKSIIVGLIGRSSNG